jgi:hypothetical protein
VRWGCLQCTTVTVDKLSNNLLTRIYRRSTIALITQITPARFTPCRRFVWTVRHLSEERNESSAPGFRRVLPRQNAMRGERAQESPSVRVQTQVCRDCRVAPQTARQSLQFPFDPPTVFAVGGFSILRIPRLKTLNVDCQKIASHTVCIRDCTVVSDLQVVV